MCIKFYYYYYYMDAIKIALAGVLYREEKMYQ